MTLTEKNQWLQEVYEQQYERFTQALQDENILMDKIIDVSINNRMVRTFGWVKTLYVLPNDQRVVEIEINPTIIDKERPMLLVNTILHELCHCIVGTCGHDKAWKRYAAIISEKLGTPIQRCSDATQYGFKHSDFRRKPKYEVVCSHCGVTIEYNKSSYALEHIWQYKCATCGHKFLVYKLR